jgi:glycosyltransferase involved in cell wall biosynthesis
VRDGLRFCMVTTFYPPYHFGGDAVYVYRLAHALAEAGHRVDVVHSMDAYRLKPSVEPPGFPDHPNVTRHPLESASPRLSMLLTHQLGRPALYARELRERLEGDYDVIHFHNVSLMGAPEVLRFGRGLKLYTAHEYWLVCPTHVLFAFDREACTEKQCLPCTVRYGRAPQAWRHGSRLHDALEHVDALLMPSHFAAERHRADGISRPLVVLPHFVPEPAVPRATLPAGERPFFLYAGRLEKLKGVQDLLPLFAEDGGADLWIAGEGSYRGVLEAAAQGRPHIRFLGVVSPARLGELYRRAVALLVPSLCYETFGLSAAEAMSHGTPVVARRIGALEEMLAQSGGGLGFTTASECRAAMQRLLAEPGLRAVLGARGAAAVRTHWSKAGHLARYLDLVRSGGTEYKRAAAVGA